MVRSRCAIIAWTLAGAAAMASAGCGFGQSGTGTTGATAGATRTAGTTATPTNSGGASAVSRAQATHERPSPTPPAQTVSDAAPTPRGAIRQFASAYINWTAVNVAQHMHALAARSVGQARSAMQLAAANTAGDYELQQGGIANRGAIMAIAPLPGRANRYVVVTLETTTASATTAYQGLRPAWHVALATVLEVAPGQWVLSAWQPEN